MKKISGGRTVEIIGALMAAIGAALTYVGTTVGCFCALGPIVSLIGASSILVGIFSLGNTAIIAAGIIILAAGIYLVFKKGRPKPGR